MFPNLCSKRRLRWILPSRVILYYLEKYYTRKVSCPEEKVGLVKKEYLLYLYDA